jgi:hypothetical protein
LFDQAFSWDHTDFFFLSETEKKLSFEISILKTELDLCRAEMETERQMHLREETTLLAQVIEAREKRDATAQEASEKVLAMKECDGIPWFFFDVFYLQILPSADLFFVAWSSSPC